MPVLTDRQLKTLATPKTGRIELTDSKCPGLKFRLTSGGHASWSVQVRVNGEKRRFTIGDYPSVGLAEARRQAEELRVRARGGYDPIREERAERQREQEEQAARTTVSEALELYAQLHLRPNLRTGAERERQLQWALSEHMMRGVHELTRVDFQKAINRKAAEGRISAANRIRAALGNFASWLYRNGHIAENIGRATAVAGKEQPRERVLSIDEVRRIFDAATALGPLWAPVVRLLILTGQRRKEVASMRWSQIDLDAARWEIPGSSVKNRKPHVVHLSPPAIAELRTVNREEGDLVFTTTGRTHVSGFSRMKERLDRLSGVTDWRLHDLRTALASALCEAGEDEAVVDRILNHVAQGSAPSAVSRVYNRANLLPQRAAALDRWAVMVTGRDAANRAA